jgi:uncharacterized protein YecT (DUF1311 family)
MTRTTALARPGSAGGLTAALVAMLALSCGTETRSAVRPSALQATATPHDACGGTTTVELDECAAANLAKADALLEQVRAEARTCSSDEGDQRLAESDQKWAEYRESFCSILRIGGGSLAGSNVAQCRADLARQRAATVCAWVSPNAPLEALALELPVCKKLRQE